jgi:hypothetical protein
MKNFKIYASKIEYEIDEDEDEKDENKGNNILF